MFTQSCIFTLKQLSDDPVLKEKVFALLSEQTGKSKLVTKFGDKEYTILSALGSSRKTTRANALQAINDPAFVKALSDNERELVKIVLLQLINQENNDEESLLQMLTATEILLKQNKIGVQDTEFESLETLLSFVCSKKV